MLAVQVLLDRARFSPGEIDGTRGPNTSRAIEAFERARKQTLAEALRSESEPATVRYTIGPEDVSGPFVDVIPEDMMEKAKLPRLDYTSALEMLGERFHAAPELLRRLNPAAKFVAGEDIVVPNVIVAASTTPPAAPPATAVIVTVSKSKSVLTVTDASGWSSTTRRRRPAATTTRCRWASGPSPPWPAIPRFHYNPDLFWDADEGHAKAAIAPGTERTGRGRVDRPEQAALRHPRHTRARDGRPHRVARLRAAHQLGRLGGGRHGGEGHQGGLRPMTRTKRLDTRPRSPSRPPAASWPAWP